MVGCDEVKKVEEVVKEKEVVKEVKRVLVDELIKKGEVYYYESKIFNGIMFDVYDNGDLKEEVNYKDGIKNGLSKRWYYENGQLRYETNYKDGKHHGLFKWWYDNGQLKEEVNYKDGKVDGLGKYWFGNGQLSWEINLKDGKFISEKCWDRKGNEIECKSQKKNMGY